MLFREFFREIVDVVNFVLGFDEAQVDEHLPRPQLSLEKRHDDLLVAKLFPVDAEVARLSPDHVRERVDDELQIAVGRIFGDQVGEKRVVHVLDAPENEVVGREVAPRLLIEIDETDVKHRVGQGRVKRPQRQRGEIQVQLVDGAFGRPQVLLDAIRDSISPSGAFGVLLKLLPLIARGAKFEAFANGGDGGAERGHELPDVRHTIGGDGGGRDGRREGRGHRALGQSQIHRARVALCTLQRLVLVLGEGVKSVDDEAQVERRRRQRHQEQRRQ